jgi:hypothetical protein
MEKCGGFSMCCGSSMTRVSQSWPMPLMLGRSRGSPTSPPKAQSFDMGRTPAAVTLLEAAERQEASHSARQLVWTLHEPASAMMQDHADPIWSS